MVRARIVTPDLVGRLCIVVLGTAGRRCLDGDSADAKFMESWPAIL